MPRIAYVERAFSAGTREVISLANAIIGEYQGQGYSLTLRQLYYQLVARGYIPNKDTEYKRLGSILNDARLAGLVDWLAIEDRTRNLRQQPHWASPHDIVLAASRQYRTNRWLSQPSYIEVWIEKDALVGVLDSICPELDVPFFSCRGYTSASEMWLAAQRFVTHDDAGRTCLLLHLGDHDPSGIDMTRDIQERLDLFCECEGLVEVRRIALTMAQIEQYAPPPNPAKITDSRYGRYVAEYGDESWELDALEPAVLVGLVRRHVEAELDWDEWQTAINAEQTHIEQLEAAAVQLA